MWMKLMQEFRAVAVVASAVMSGAYFNRVTSTGDDRVTSDGDIRVIKEI